MPNIPNRDGLGAARPDWLGVLMGATTQRLGAMFATLRECAEEGNEMAAETLMAEIKRLDAALKEAEAFNARHSELQEAE